MPLMNSPFTPGKCLETVEAMEEGAQYDIAWAEYCYFSGQPRKRQSSVQDPTLNQTTSAHASLRV